LTQAEPPQPPDRRIMPNSGALEPLQTADPELAATVASVLNRKDRPLAPEAVAMLTERTLWALSEEISFGRDFAIGYVGLLGAVDADRIDLYAAMVRRAGRNGPTLGRLMALHLPPVLRCGGADLLADFRRAVKILLDKGTYALKTPLETLTYLLALGETQAGKAFLGLLSAVFARPLTYNRTQHFASVLPRTVRSLSPARRGWQIDVLRRIASIDGALTDPLLEGMQGGLTLLEQDPLERFLDHALKAYAKDRKRGIRFLSLCSKLGRDTCAAYQVTVPLSQVRPQLQRYLKARLGRFLAVRPLSLRAGSESQAADGEIRIYSDGRSIYLPAEIGCFGSARRNAALYKDLVRFEAGLYEVHTFDFDLQRWDDRYGPGLFGAGKASDAGPWRSDLEAFWQRFARPRVAADLMTIFEHGRIRRMLSEGYPGLANRILPVLRQEARRIYRSAENRSVLSDLYRAVALADAPRSAAAAVPGARRQVDGWRERFEAGAAEDDSAEASAALAAQIYPAVCGLLNANRSGPARRPLLTPFGLGLRPDLYAAAVGEYDRTALALQRRLAARGLKVYRADLRNSLLARNGRLESGDLTSLAGSDALSAEASRRLLEEIDPDRRGPEGAAACDGSVHWYPEWDHRLADYLPRHVRVRDRFIAGCGGDFYQETLRRHSGLAARLRYAFELLKPQGLQILRRWKEGDGFDYRALLDFVIDRKAGRIPSERLYIKRLKQQRDVAALLLIDLSRSTANPVSGGSRALTVLDVEKEAIVLFCEALSVLGDDFALAGFSGTGRLGVDYFRVKEFGHPMDRHVRRRICAMTPQRGTRMGAAIRHASRQLAAVTARVRLLIILGDGFPNDSDYKRRYAMADTRRAMAEARSNDVHARAITVNIADDPHLDDLYGPLHHNVIADVHELPDKLLRIYRTLTC